MDKARILELMAELEAVLSEERAGQMDAPPGFTMVRITAETIEANEEQSAVRRSLEITLQILDLCPASKGLKEYIFEMVDTSCRVGMPAPHILRFFGVLEDDWTLFDPSGIKEQEYKWLEGDARSLFFFLLGSLMVMIPDELAEKITAKQASRLFEQMMTPPSGKWLTRAELEAFSDQYFPVREMWTVRFEQARRILSWIERYTERYGEPPPDFDELVRRINQFLEYSK